MKLTKLNSNNPLITKATIKYDGVDYPVHYRDNIGNIFEVRFMHNDGWPRFCVGTLKDGKIVNYVEYGYNTDDNSISIHDMLINMVMACPQHVKALSESGGQQFTQRGRLYCTYGNKNWDELHAKNVAAGIIA